MFGEADFSQKMFTNGLKTFKKFEIVFKMRCRNQLIHSFKLTEELQ